MAEEPTVDQPAKHQPAPASPRDLFVSFTRIALQGFGGVLPIIQYQLVDQKQWLTREEFIEEWAVAQILPGPNVVNLSLMLGARYFGLRGALAALAGMLLVPTLIVLVLGILYATFAGNPAVAAATRGMGAVAAGLIIATGVKLTAALKFNPLGKVLCTVLGLVCFIFIALLRWPLLEILVIMGPLGWLLAWRALKAEQ